MSIILNGLGGNQLILQGFGESAATAAGGSVQARQQSGGVGYVRDRVVIPQGGFGTFAGVVGFSRPKTKPITGRGHSSQAGQQSEGAALENSGISDEDIELMMMFLVAAEQGDCFV